MKRTDPDKKCLVFDSGPLSSDTEVTGHPIADLWVSSNQKDGDFYVYLADVDEKGESIYVTEGQLRAGWHRLHGDDDQVWGVLNVLPDMPWHGFRKETYMKDSLAGGKVLNMRFALMPTSWKFKKGHRIRISIGGPTSPISS